MPCALFSLSIGECASVARYEFYVSYDVCSVSASENCYLAVARGDYIVRVSSLEAGRVSVVNSFVSLMAPSSTFVCSHKFEVVV